MSNEKVQFRRRNKRAEVKARAVAIGNGEVAPVSRDGRAIDQICERTFLLLLVVLVVIFHCVLFALFLIVAGLGPAVLQKVPRLAEHHAIYVCFAIQLILQLFCGILTNFAKCQWHVRYGLTVVSDC
jgi:hypothetical protein